MNAVRPPIIAVIVNNGPTTRCADKCLKVRSRPVGDPKNIRQTRGQTEARDNHTLRTIQARPSLFVIGSELNRSNQHFIVEGKDRL